jgi:beta-xylosidase
MMDKDFQNPLPIKNIGDPFILRTVSGTYYCYATSAQDGFKAWKSDDLVDWQEIGYVYTRQKNSWGVSDFWAPEVIYFEGEYYLHYSARWEKT